MVKRCLWCGKPITEGRSDKKFCKASCRVMHCKAVHGGVRLSVPEGRPMRRKAEVSGDEVAAAVAQARSALAVFDAGARKAPGELRPFCCLMAARLASALEEVGL